MDVSTVLCLLAIWLIVESILIYGEKRMARDKELIAAQERFVQAIARITYAADQPSNHTPDAAVDSVIEKLNGLCATVEAKYPIPPVTK